MGGNITFEVQPGTVTLIAAGPGGNAQVELNHRFAAKYFDVQLAPENMRACAPEDQGGIWIGQTLAGYTGSQIPLHLVDFPRKCSHCKGINSCQASARRVFSHQGNERLPGRVTVQDV